MNKELAYEVLTAGMNIYDRKVNKRLLDDLIKEFMRRPDPLSVGVQGDESRTMAQRLLSYLKTQVEENLATVFSLRRRYAEYAKRYSRATTIEDRERHILAFSGDLGSSDRQLMADKKALSRWFDHDAIVERYGRRHSFLERNMTFVLERIGFLAEQTLLHEPENADLATEWRLLLLEQTLRPFFAYEGDSRVCLGAFRALARALRALPAEMRERSVDESTLRFIYRSAMHLRLDVWLQCEALTLLESLSAHSFEKVLFQRLTRPAAGDDLFVRRRAVQLLGKNLNRIPRLAGLFATVAEDPSPFVRQGLAAVLAEAPAEVASQWFRFLSTEDSVPQVRAAAVLQGLKLLERIELQREVISVLQAVFKKETDSLVLRTAIHVAAEGTSQLIRAEDPFVNTWCPEVTASLEALHVTAEKISVRRWAAMAKERIWCESDHEAWNLKSALDPYLVDLTVGDCVSIPRSLLENFKQDTIGRVLSVLSQRDFGYELESRALRFVLWRGHRFGFKWWRFLHEMRHPAPDKRQAHRHTIGRKFRGKLRAPSAILGELAETRVPGEPLYIAEEGGWRHYLPLLEETLSTLKPGFGLDPVKIFTSEGITELSPPDTELARLLAWYKITAKFPTYAKLRNWHSKLQEGPAVYAEALDQLGFTLGLRPHASSGKEISSSDPEVQRFFPEGAAISSMVPFSIDSVGELWERIQQYFVSIYDNSLLELGLFMGAVTSLFVGKHLNANRVMRKCRQRMPLVIGGWGTRGKSGTERLKAALFNALGFGLVSKTTGCEAMFLYSPPFGETRELFLFRSYDKATIWEQRDILCLADQLGAEVFLWECMALTPAYVDVLQRHWVRDDVSTITNTYPDHEDLQGPAGYNVPEVIARFIPRRSKVITTEEDMLPILSEAAKRFQSELTSVTWLEAGLLPPDVLDRFPYEEHPNNIALVLAMADELGVDRDFALKEMADRVIADLGVLKTSPVAFLRTRRLQFTNGCSANERLAALGNWTRLEFDQQDPYAEPGVWITTVINNRADRVPRSRVFARMIVEDLHADRHFIIGGNAEGFVGYVRQSWEEFAAKLSLWPKDGADEATALLQEMAQRFRQPTEEGHVMTRLSAMLEGMGLPAEQTRKLKALWRDPEALAQGLANAKLGEIADSVVEHTRKEAELLKEYEEFRLKVEQAVEGQRESLDAEFRELLWTWFYRKLVVIDDYYISGNQLANTICDATPPGYLNRLMGVQNIKGTALDFVYCWQAWEACHKACTQLRSQDPFVVERGLRALSSFRDYGVLCEEYMEETLEAVKGSPVTQSENFQAELALIRSGFSLAMNEIREKSESLKGKGSKFEKAVAAVEGFFDAGDAVKRRKQANRIYKDLADERISTERAALELQALNKRQKGGWLQQQLMLARRVMVQKLSQFLMRRVK